MGTNIPSHETRSLEQLREQYIVEKELANRLRTANKEERRKLYTQMYDELFRRIPHHPQHKKKKDPIIQRNKLNAQLRLLQPFLSPACVFLEIGAGDCSLSFEIAKKSDKVYAVDVSEEITQNQTKPENFKLILSDGSSIPVEKDSIDLAYSNQLMEHLHAEDATDQLGNILIALKKGGSYLCITPNRIHGPSDISKYFNDAVATGLHLKEYTYKELAKLFTQIGFSKIRSCLRVKGLHMIVPVFPLVVLETILQWLPKVFSQKLSNWYPLRVLLEIRLIATK